MSFSENLIEAIKETSLLEWTGIGTSIAYVLLAAYGHILCWFFGLISSAIYVYICFFSQLYIESGLQIFYLIMSIYGWIIWKSKNKSIVQIRTRNIQFHILALILCSIGAYLLALLFDTYTDQAFPYLDASIAVFSLMATFMTAHKILENWIYWIVVDFAAIFLYESRDLAMTAGLYIVFTTMAIYGLIQWTKRYKQQDSGKNAYEIISSNP